MLQGGLPTGASWGLAEVPGGQTEGGEQPHGFGRKLPRVQCSRSMNFKAGNAECGYRRRRQGLSVCGGSLSLVGSGEGMIRSVF